MARAVSGSGFDLIRPQEFISSGDYHLYVGEMGANREFLKDVIIIQMHTAEPSDIQSRQSHKRDSIIFAKSATHVETGNGQIQLDLQQGRRYEVDQQVANTVKLALNAIA